MKYILEIIMVMGKIIKIMIREKKKEKIEKLVTVAAPIKLTLIYNTN